MTDRLVVAASADPVTAGNTEASAHSSDRKPTFPIARFVVFMLYPRAAAGNESRRRHPRLCFNLQVDVRPLRARHPHTVNIRDRHPGVDRRPGWVPHAAS